jgi:hypothetical protein
MKNGLKLLPLLDLKSKRGSYHNQEKSCNYMKKPPARSLNLEPRNAASDNLPHSRKETGEISLTSLFCPLISCQHLSLIN